MLGPFHSFRHAANCYEINLLSHGFGNKETSSKRKEETIPKAEDAIHTFPYPQHKQKAIACPETVRFKILIFWD